MFNIRSQRSSLFIVLGIAIALVRSAAANAETTANLLVNGDAELHGCSDDWTAQTSVPGWRVLRGAASVLCYSAFQLSGDTPVTPNNAQTGNALFGAPGADTAMEQSVDVSAAAAAVDGGAVQFNLSGWLGGWRNRPERATVTAVFLDRSGNATGAPVVIADVDANARSNLTGLVQRQATGTVPAFTRQIVVTVHFLSGMTSFHNAYADNLSLQLSGVGVGGLVPAAAVPPAADIPPLDHVFVVMMENTNYADVVQTAGTSATVDPQMPFTASLASSGVILSNMWGTYHPSDQNYVAMVAGDTFKYGPVYYPDFDLPAAHLGDLLDAQGKSWRAYVQYMNKPCNLVSQKYGTQDSYSPDDEPFANFRDVVADAARCAAHLRDLTDFEAAIASNTLPDFAWIAADNWWDGEGAWYETYDVAYSNARQDQFLQATLQPLVQSAQWRNSRSLLILTWDETGSWGWPDNRVPTILVGSPGLLRAATVSQEHASGYDVLRTIEGALGVGSLGRFDQFAQPMNTVFATAASPAGSGAAGDLWPTQAVASRGSIQETFGQASTPAAVEQGQPLTLVVPSRLDDSTVVVLAPLGQVPAANAASYRFASDNVSVSIPTGQLAPGVYGAWLRRGSQPPYRAPLMATILPPATVSAQSPGVEILGAALSGNPSNVSVREGSNFIVRYCRPSGVTVDNGWIGIFPVGAKSSFTKHDANVIGFWLKTPGNGGQACGDAEAYASELAPNQAYQVMLFEQNSSGVSSVIGKTAAFNITPSLPH